MWKILNVAREEIAYHTQYWSFYIVTLGVPLIFAAVGAIPRLQLLAEDTSMPEVETVFTIDDVVTVPTGYVDYADLITHIPAEQAQNFRAFANESAAKVALQRGDIESYYVIATDYLTSGEVTQYSQNPQLLARTDVPVRRLLADNLLYKLDNSRLAARLDEPVNLIRRGPSTTPTDSFLPAGLDWQRLASAGLIVGLFAYTINVSGALMVRALQREVKMRVLEILVSSTTPTQFIGGKIVGLSSIALGQVSLTLVAVVWVYGNNPDGSGPAALPLTNLVLTLPYLLLGLVAYCGLVMSMAALWPDPRESGMLLTIAYGISMSPLIGALFILPDLDGWLAILLTLFPPTAAVLMTFRLLLTDVPLWQWIISLIGLLGWASLTVKLSIRLFRARGLMTGQPLSWQMIRHLL